MISLSSSHPLFLSPSPPLSLSPFPPNPQLSLSKSLAVDSMERSAAASVSYVRPNVHFAASSDLSFPLSKPVVNASAVMLNQGWVLGAEALLDTGRQRLCVCGSRSVG